MTSLTTPKEDYLKAFQLIDRTDHENDFELIGDILLVREIQAAEVKTAGGIYMPTAPPRQMDGFSANLPCFVEVLKTGKGYYDEEGEFVPLDTRPGDIALVGKLSVKWVSVLGALVSSPENNFGFVRESEIQARSRGREKFETYFRKIDDAARLVS